MTTVRTISTWLGKLDFSCTKAESDLVQVAALSEIFFCFFFFFFPHTRTQQTAQSTDSNIIYSIITKMVVSHGLFNVMLFICCSICSPNKMPKRGANSGTCVCEEDWLMIICPLCPPPPLFCLHAGFMTT